MSALLPPSAVAAAFVWACRLEVRALKPGNVHVHAAGHGMTVADFDRSAEAAAPFIADTALKVGERIRRAVEATIAAAACNTNLGIVLLCAPLAAAAGRELEGGDMTERLRAVLEALDADDAREAFKAIAHASPAGLGTVEGADVRSEPPAGMTLLQAMEQAAERDLVADEYRTRFHLVRSLCIDSFEPMLARGRTAEQAMAHIYLIELTRRLDTHIIRKHGVEAARFVEARARRALSELGPALERDPGDPNVLRGLLGLDTELKEKGFNPGALADVMAAVAFLSQLRRETVAPGRTPPV